jgi:hypothetical protein
MPIPIIPSTPYGDIQPHWTPYLDALDEWTERICAAELTPPVRPFLYQPAGDVEVVRQRVDEHPGMRESIVGAAEQHLSGDLPSPSAEGDSPHPMRPWIGNALVCANAWLISGDNRFADRAWEIVQLAMVWPEWIAIEHKPLTIDLRSASLVRSLALIRDRLAGTLDSVQTNELESFLAGEVVRYVSICDAHTEWWTHCTHNWRTVVCGGYGTAALSVMQALPGDVLTRALRHSAIGAFVVLDSGDPDGGWFEGVSYWKYGIGEAIEFIDALRNASLGAVDILTHPYLQKTGDFGLYLTWPDGRVYDWGDCGERVNATQLMARLAGVTGRGDWQEYCRRFPTQPSLDTLFWEDPDLAPVPLDTLPKVKCFRGTEVGVLRTGWADDDVIVGVKAGESTANHSHLDIGSFAIVAGGKTLVGDGGHWDYAFGEYFFDNDGPRWDYPGLATECHSTLLIDGQGQKYGSEYRGVIAGSGSFPSVGGYPGWSYITVDATDAYPQLKRFVRYILLIEPDTVVVVDDLRSTGDRVRYGWRAILPNPMRRKSTESDQIPDWPVWTSRHPDDGPALTLRWLTPLDDTGLIVEETTLDAIYRSRGGTSNHTTKMLTVSPMIRARETMLAVAMRVGRDGTYIEPEVIAEAAYRSLRIVVQTNAGPRVWSIMEGDPGIQAFT